ncbi:MAG: proline--tRNA ligase [Alphaproteobacteria bacterium]|nr:proline--tRNA ligase [Alphaproteobacteria bacterium]
MRRSSYFLPILKENPTEAQIVSHRLMLRGGMVRQSAAGIYTWLPLGLRVLRRIERIVREEQDAAGCQELLMPTIQPAELWRESGRYDVYGKEMLRITDRHEREMLFGPTNEELITDIFRQAVKSYRDLPKLLYHIQWKFRDEIRPRFGVMRGREFLMKDSYSFDLDYAGAKRAYNKMFVAYLRTFARMDLKAIPMKAESGPIGGDMSHEFIILADTGETEVFCDRSLIEYDVLRDSVDFDGDLEPYIKRWTQYYAATSDKHDPAAFAALPVERRVTARGIEIGHIFYFGKKYSEAMKATVTGPNGEAVAVEMGSYGIGVSRLVGGIIEANHDDAGIVWPKSVAPFQVGIINLKPGDADCDAASQETYRKLNESGVETFLDDLNESPGSKFATMDLIGLPWQIVIGPRGLKKGIVELKERRSGKREELSTESALSRVLS